MSATTQRPDPVPPRHAGRPARHSALIAGAGVLMLAAAACASGGSGQSAASGGSSGGGSGSKAKAASSSMEAIAVRKTSLGKILVDSKGRTLYMFAIDKPGKSNCTGACLKYWPVATAPSGKPSAVSAVTAKLGTDTARNGMRQLTAGGWPLYLFLKDKAPGDVKGQGLKTFGGAWYVLSPAGKPIRASVKAAKSGSSGGSGSGGGSGSSSGGGGWG